jgi:hypothetical protein
MWITVIMSHSRKSSIAENSSNILNGFLVSTSNRYDLLSHLQESATPTYSSDNQETTFAKKTMETKTSTLNKYKIVIIVDSQMKGCSDKLAHRLTYDVTGFCKPNADSEAVTSMLNT